MVERLSIILAESRRQALFTPRGATCATEYNLRLRPGLHQLVPELDCLVAAKLALTLITALIAGPAGSAERDKALPVRLTERHT